MSSPSTLVRRAAGLVAVAALALGLVAPAQAEGDLDDLRSEREENRREAAEAAAQIDALSAEDRELVDALADLDAHIALQESKVAASEAAIVAAEERAVEARADAEALDAEMVAIRDRLRDTAVDAFVGVGREAAEQLDNADLTGEAVRRYLLDEVVDDEVDVVDELRSAEARRLQAEEAAEAAAAEAEAERVANADRLADLEVAKAEAEELRAEVQARLGQWEATAASIEQADREIEAEIQRLEEEAARRAAEAEALRLEQERIRQQQADTGEGAAEGEAAAEGEGADDAPAVPNEAFVPPADGSFAITHRPSPGGWSSGFGPRIHPIFGTGRMHYGIDFHGSGGDPIYAASAGTVLTSGWRNGYGNTVVISHGNGYTTLYAHQSSIAVSAGATVAGGQVIGYVGSTGWSTGPHLHFEVRVNGTAVDPARYL